MGVASGLVLYLIIWFMTFLVILPIRIQTQGKSLGRFTRKVQEAVAAMGKLYFRQWTLLVYRTFLFRLTLLAMLML
ncbi:MAG: DUF1467 family protein [Pseudomonadota bacterium]